MYKNMRAGNVKLEKLNEAYDSFQKAYGERLFNEDADFSYIAPYIELGDESYFGMAQGTKESQRHYFLRNRFDYLDSKFNAGNALANAITVRGYQANNLKVKYNMPIYASIKYGSQLVQQRLEEADIEVELPIPAGMTINDTETYIYSCDRLTSIDGLADYQIGYADFSKASMLRDVYIGKHDDPTYSNLNFTTLRMGNNKLLETLDCGGCENLTGNIDVSGCENLETAYFNRTGITGITLPNGNSIKNLYLPSSLTQLKIVNQNIPNFNWNDGATAFYNLNQCWLENCSIQFEGSEIDIASAIIGGDFQDGCYVRFIGYDFYVEDGTEASVFVNNVNKLHGIDETGQLVDNAVISGDLYINTPISMTTYNNLTTAMPYLTIHAEILPSIILSMTTETSESDEDEPTTTTQQVELCSFTDYEEPTIIEENTNDLSQYRISSDSSYYSPENHVTWVDRQNDYMKYTASALAYGVRLGSMTYPSDHKVYVCFEIKSDKACRYSLGAYTQSGNFDVPADTWTLYHEYKTSGSSFAGYLDAVSGATAPVTTEIRNLRIYDLTAEFGAGNEPTEEECVAQGCFLKKITIIGTTVTQEAIDASVNVAQLMFPSGKQIIQDNINTYKHLNQCNYRNLLSEHLGEPVYEDIEIDATQYRKKVNNRVNNVLYESQTTYRETLIGDISLADLQALTINDFRLANHANHDDPTEIVPKPKAFSITKTNARTYSNADAFDLSELDEETLISTYVENQWEFDTHDMIFKVFAIYSETLAMLLYGVNLAKPANTIKLGDLLTQDSTKCLASIFCPAHDDTASYVEEEYNPMERLYFINLEDTEDKAHIQESGINKADTYWTNKYGADSTKVWKSNVSIGYNTASKVYTGVVFFKHKTTGEKAYVKICSNVSMYDVNNYGSAWRLLACQVNGIKQLQEESNLQNFTISNDYTLVGMIPAPIIGLQSNANADTFFVNGKGILNYVPVSIAGQPSSSYAHALDKLYGYMMCGVFNSSKTSLSTTYDYTKDKIINTGGTNLTENQLVDLITVRPVRGWIVPIDIEQLSEIRVACSYDMTNATLSTLFSTNPGLANAFGGFGEYNVRTIDGRVVNILDAIQSTISSDASRIGNVGFSNYIINTNLGSEIQYLMGFSDPYEDSNQASVSNGIENCVTVDIVIYKHKGNNKTSLANTSASDVIYQKKNFSTYSFDEDMPTINCKLQDSDGYLAFMIPRAEGNLMSTPSARKTHRFGPYFMMHLISEDTTDIIFQGYIASDAVGYPSGGFAPSTTNMLFNYRLWNTWKRDYMVGYIQNCIPTSSSPSVTASNVLIGDGSSNCHGLINFMLLSSASNNRPVFGGNAGCPSEIRLNIKNVYTGEITTINNIIKYCYYQTSYDIFSLEYLANWHDNQINGKGSFNQVVIHNTAKEIRYDYGEARLYEYALSTKYNSYDNQYAYLYIDFASIYRDYEELRPLLDHYFLYDTSTGKITSTSSSPTGVDHWTWQSSSTLFDCNIVADMVYGNGLQSIPTCGAENLSDHSYVSKMNPCIMKVQNGGSYSTDINSIENGGIFSKFFGRTNTNYIMPTSKPSATMSTDLFRYNFSQMGGFVVKLYPNGYISQVNTSYRSYCCLTQSEIDYGASYMFVFHKVDYANWRVKRGYMKFTVMPTDEEGIALEHHGNDSWLGESKLAYTTPRFIEPVFNLTNLIDIYELDTSGNIPTDSDRPYSFSGYFVLPRDLLAPQEEVALNDIKDYVGIEQMMADTTHYKDWVFAMWDDYYTISPSTTKDLSDFNSCTYEQFKQTFLM